MLQRQRGDSQVMVQSHAGDAFQAVPSADLEDAFWGGSQFYPKPRGREAASPTGCVCSASRILGRQMRSELPIGPGCLVNCAEGAAVQGLVTAQS